jgi:hypothetical protein
MEASPLVWLASEHGRQLLEKAESLPPDRLTRISRLRKLVSPDLANAAVELIELRARAAAKFARSAEMLFTQIGLEQSTGERIAKYRASRFPLVPILDACSGIGGDALHLAARGPVLAVDCDLPSSVCTSHNCGIRTELTFPERFQVRTLCADVTEIDLLRLYDAGFRAVFLDPGRRRTGTGGASSRIRNPEEYSPPLSYMDRLCEVFPCVCTKVSPFVEDQALVSRRCPVEFISDRGECKEAVLWVGDFEQQQTQTRGYTEDVRAGYSATVIGSSGLSSTLKSLSCPMPTVSAPGSWIFEPDAAVVRAHLTPVLAAYLHAKILDPSSYYLTSDSAADTPFATRYRLLEILPLRPADIQKRCIALGRAVTAVKTRWMSISPDNLLKRVPGAGKGAPAAIIIVAKVDERHMALICEPSAKAAN